MLITVTSTAVPASDMGYLLHKHPDKVQEFEVSVGTATVFYPEVSDDSCTVALMLEVDPIALVRGKRFGGSDAFSLAQYVNDRPYAASSMMSVTLGKVFRTAMTGRCDSRPDLAQSKLPLKIHVPALPCRGGAQLASDLFEPLGWTVQATPIPLDPELPEWGDSRYVDLRLSGEVRLADALNHLYVLLPVLDDAKHYWVSNDEVDKLIRAGGGWLAGHPKRELISKRYLSHRKHLVATATQRLIELDTSEEVEESFDEDAGLPVEKAVPLVQHRHAAVLKALKDANAQTVADVGCGPGALLTQLVADQAFTKITGADVSARALDIAEKRLRIDRLNERQSARLNLIQSSATYTDARLSNHDALVLMEVIEHIDPPRLQALERSIFGFTSAPTVIVTTPNCEYNERYELAAGAMRHSDHRFEWNRAQFSEWTQRVCDEFGYSVRIVGVGDEDPVLGAPTQLAIFTKEAAT